MPSTKPRRCGGALALIQYSERMKSTVSAMWRTARRGNHIQNDGATWKPTKARAPARIIASMVATTPKRTASGMASGAAAIEAMPATAVLRPIIVAEWPRLSRMTLSSGVPRPIAMPTTLMAEIAAPSGSHRNCAGSAPPGVWGTALITRDYSRLRRKRLPRMR
jgi:hypothetical protein